MFKFQCSNSSVQVPRDQGWAFKSRCASSGLQICTFVLEIDAGVWTMHPQNGTYLQMQCTRSRTFSVRNVRSLCAESALQHANERTAFTTRCVFFLISVFPQYSSMLNSFMPLGPTDLHQPVVPAGRASRSCQPVVHTQTQTHTHLATRMHIRCTTDPSH